MSTAPTLEVRKDRVRVTTPEGLDVSMPLAEFLEQVSPHTLDSGGVVLPDGAKFLVPGRNAALVVHQTPPRLYSFRWIATDSEVPYGKATKYRDVVLALPYVIVIALFQAGGDGTLRLSGWNECFFRNRPLRSPDDVLLYPALLNCSRHPPERENVPLAWICTQKLNRDNVNPEWDDNERVRHGMDQLLRHLFDTGFNRSSEHHEGSSWFTETVNAELDPRLSSVETWQEASRENPAFATEIPWIPTGLTLRQITERTLKCNKLSRERPSAIDWTRIVINHGS